MRQTAENLLKNKKIRNREKAMFLHGGGNKNLKKSEIIGIFDLDSASIGQKTKVFLRSMEKQGKTRNIGSGLPKSFLVTVSKKEGETVYFSALAATTLAQRAKTEYSDLNKE